jgi:uncharacterized protein (UPF0276 family)
MSDRQTNQIEGVGLGLRHRHFQEFIDDKPDVPWLEIHTENFFSADCSASNYLEKIRVDYPLSAHSVGLSLGSSSVDCPVREQHLQKIKETVDRLQPTLVSDHLSWSASDSVHYLPDLLPVPYTDEALNVMVQNIDHVQTVLKRQILVENPSSYLSFKDSSIPEWEFLSILAEKSGCGILLDVNNIYVNAHNHGFDPSYYLQQIPVKPVQEIHLAGYSVREIEGEEVYIDTHGHRVYDSVWDLYVKAVDRFGAVPTLIEWDVDIPELSVLMEEKAKAEAVFAKAKKGEAA